MKILNFKFSFAFKFCFLLFVLLFVQIASAQSFGDVKVVDKDGNDIEPEKDDFGGNVYTAGEGNVIQVDYNGNEVDYSKLSGKLTFSDAGKLIAGEFDVKSDGTFVIGNLELDLSAGSEVTYVDGKLSIVDPGKTLSKDDVSFVDSELSWDENSIALSGDGVDYMGLDEVNLDKDGYFLQDPEGVKFDDFTVYGKGKVYFISDSGGVPNLEVKGAYLSVNPAEGKFTLGSNVLGESISVMPNKENQYGLRHDQAVDYISFRSIGSANPSYLTVENREGAGFVPNVNAVGYFAIDNNGNAVYRGADNKIYSVMAGHVNNEFGATGTTASPIELHMSDLVNGELVKLTAYEGIVGFGNDNAIGYGFNPTFILGGEYGTAAGKTHGRYEGYNLNYGISNTLAYNYDLTKETIEKVFGLNINDQVGYLNNPANVRMMYDTLARLPKAAGYLKNLNFLGSSGNTQGKAGMRGGTNFLNLYKSGQHPGILSHELTHIFDYYSGKAFDNEWNAVNGANGPHSRKYGATSRAEAKATIGEVIFVSDNWWQNFFAGKAGYQNNAGTSIRMAAKVAVLAKYGHIQDYDAARILRFANINVDPTNPTFSYNEIIARVKR